MYDRILSCVNRKYERRQDDVKEAHTSERLSSLHNDPECPYSEKKIDTMLVLAISMNCNGVKYNICRMASSLPELKLNQNSIAARIRIAKCRVLYG
jgi:hypothetical protein